MKSQTAILLLCICMLFPSTGGSAGSLSKSLGAKVRALENHREEQMAGADPEQSCYRGVGAGRRC